MSRSTAASATTHNSQNDEPGGIAIPVRLRKRPVLPYIPTVAEPEGTEWPDPAQVAEHADDDASQASEPGKADYEVGYGKPPRHSQFKKGQSGNPHGRPKGAKSAKTIAREILQTKRRVKIDGKTRNLTALEIALNQQAKQAMNGDRKALEFLASLMPEEAEPGAHHALQPEKLDETDRAMLAYHQRETLLAPELGLSETQVAAILARFSLSDTEEDVS